MRAYEIVSDKGIDALALNQRDLPQPGKGEILVGIRASSRRTAPAGPCSTGSHGRSCKRRCCRTG